MTADKYGRANDAADTSDIFQDVMLRLVARGGHLLRSFDPSRGSLRTWLAVVARSVTLDALRRRPSREVSVDETFFELTPAPVARENEPGRTPLFPHPALSTRQNQVMGMIFDRDMDVREVAGLLAVGEQTVRSLKHQALTRLRGMVAQPA
ncbi:RNA polymerase sigma factor [Desulfovibrio sp. X2]|uniref:RNA polymerase sigma factor n=1 Tax=Desulfovibrio sp. X2 TaxID=941449 RepID=UPI001F279D38|nr:sigma-70 family RNA polymerase sigma factor [Desulfovibrio sp. X2]